MSYHQTLILIDVTDAALKNNAYMERANRLLECVNKPDTIKANVACITDKIHKMINPGQMISFGIMSKLSGRGDTFNPNSEAVTAFIKNAGFCVVIPFTAIHNNKQPKPKFSAAAFKTQPIFTAPTHWDAPYPTPIVDPELEKLLTEEEEIEKTHKQYGVLNKAKATIAATLKTDTAFGGLKNVAPFGLPPILMSESELSWSAVADSYLNNYNIGSYNITYGYPKPKS